MYGQAVLLAAAPTPVEMSRVGIGHQHGGRIVRDVKSSSARTPSSSRSVSASVSMEPTPRAKSIARHRGGELVQQRIPIGGRECREVIEEFVVPAPGIRLATENQLSGSWATALTVQACRGHRLLP